MAYFMIELKEFVNKSLKELDERIAKDMANEQLLEKEFVVEEISKSDETLFLLELRDKLVVLFEGLKDDELEDLDAKLELTLNFLEYVLTLIEKRLDGRVIE